MEQVSDAQYGAAFAPERENDNLTLLELVMTRPCSPHSGFRKASPRLPLTRSWRRKLVDFSENRSVLLPSILSQEIQAQAGLPRCRRQLTDESRGQTLDIVSTTKDALELLAATAALAISSAGPSRTLGSLGGDRTPFPGWRKFPGAYSFGRRGSSKISPSGMASCSPRVCASSGSRFRTPSARDAVSAAIGLLPKVSVEGEDMIVSYFARKNSVGADRQTLKPIFSVHRRDHKTRAVLDAGGQREVTVLVLV